MNRRGLLSGLLATMVLPARAALGEGRLGLAISSYSHRWRGEYASFRIPPFKDALDVMDHVRGLGVGSLQINVENWTLDFAKQVRQSGESYDMRLEGSLKLPLHAGDVARYERELRTAYEAGARVFRSALGGRRYEVFNNRADFEQWRTGARQAMLLAEPMARRLGVKIGIENHKDWELTELVAALDAVGSEHVGACVDLGNSVALLEDPLTVVETLAPYAVTVHLKDVAVRPTETGFQMSEVPLGQGCLDLPALVKVLHEARPEAVLHLEMMTRDPLEIPCLRAPYWETFPEKPGVDLARMLTWVQAHAAEKLVNVSPLSTEATLELEEANVVASLEWMGAVGR